MTSYTPGQTKKQGDPKVTLAVIYRFLFSRIFLPFVLKRMYCHSHNRYSKQDHTDKLRGRQTEDKATDGISS